MGRAPLTLLSILTLTVACTTHEHDAITPLDTDARVDTVAPGDDIVDRETAPDDDVATHETHPDDASADGDGDEPRDAIAPTGAHPRIFLTPERLAELATKRAADAFAWRFMIGRVAEDSSYEPHTPELAAANALAYRVTGDPTYLARAREKVEDFYATWDYGDPSGLTFQWYGRYLAWCYDWLHSDLDGATRARWAGWIQVANETWLARIDYANGGATRPTDGIRTEDTDHTLMIMENFAYAGVALAGEAEPFSTTMLEASDTIWDGVVLARYIPDHFAGGFDPVGPMYAGYQGAHMARTDLLRGESRHLPRARAFFDRYLEAMIHQDFPGFAGQLQHGDMHPGNYQPDGWSTEQWPPYNSVDTLAMLAGLTTDPALRDHALYNLSRYRAAHADGALLNAYHTGIDLALFLPDGEPSAAAALAGRPLAFRAAHFATARTSWGDDASALFVQAAPWNMDHTHRDAGHFTLVRRGRAVTSDVAGYPSSGSPTCDSTLAHNALLIENSRGGEQAGVNSDARTGDVRIDRFDAQPDFTYVATDVAAAYEYLGWNGVDSSGDDFLAHALRKVVWVHPDLLIVYDHVALREGVAPRWMRSLMHLHGAPAELGTRFVGEADGNAYAFEPILPVGAGTTLTSDQALLTAGPPDFMEGQKHGLVIVDAGAISESASFLGVLAVADAGASPQASVTAFTAAGGWQGLVWQFRGARGVIVMKAGPGALTAVTYVVPADGATTHVITDLPPATEVGVTTSVVDGELRVSVSSSGVVQRSTTAEGSLTLRTDATGALVP